MNFKQLTEHPSNQLVIKYSLFKLNFKTKKCKFKEFLAYRKNAKKSLTIDFLLTIVSHYNSLPGKIRVIKTRRKQYFIIQLKYSSGEILKPDYLNSLIVYLVYYSCKIYSNFLKL